MVGFGESTMRTSILHGHEWLSAWNIKAKLDLLSVEQEQLKYIFEIKGNYLIYF